MRSSNFRASSVFRSVAQTLAVLVISAIALEFYARVHDALQWGAPLLQNYSHNVFSELHSDGLPCAPEKEFEKWSLNRFGFRGGEFPKLPSENEIRVFLVGASEVFGLYESPLKEVAPELSQYLNAVGPHSYRVVNASCIGLPLPLVKRVIENRVAALDPDIILIYPTPHFYLDKEPPSLGNAVPKQSSHSIESRFIRKIKSAIKSLLPSSLQTRFRQLLTQREINKHPAQWLWELAPTERLRLFRQHLNSVIEAAISAAPRVFLVTHASSTSTLAPDSTNDHLTILQRFYPRATYRTILDFERAANSIIKEQAEQYGCHLFDADKALSSTPEFFADYSHFTDKGAQVFASLLASSIVSVQSDEELNR